MKNAVFWDVEPCRSRVNRCFRGTYPLYLQGRRKKEKNLWARNQREQVAAGSLRVGILFFLLPWRWRRYVPPIRRFIRDLHGGTSQKTTLFTFIKIRINIILSLYIWLTHFWFPWGFTNKFLCLFFISCSIYSRTLIILIPIIRTAN
jgi:hypothetical protein